MQYVVCTAEVGAVVMYSSGNFYPKRPRRKPMRLVSYVSGVLTVAKILGVTIKRRSSTFTPLRILRAFFCHVTISSSDRRHAVTC